jgi:hypothetical protein
MRREINFDQISATLAALPERPSKPQTIREVVYQNGRKIEKMVEFGWTLTAIAREMGIHVAVLQKYFREFQAESAAGITVIRKRGRPKRILEATEAAVTA